MPPGKRVHIFSLPTAVRMAFKRTDLETFYGDILLIAETQTNEIKHVRREGKIDVQVRRTLLLQPFDSASL
jgi:hypothetical protein